MSSKNNNNKSNANPYRIINAPKQEKKSYK